MMPETHRSVAVAALHEDTRGRFVVRTYLHLFGAIAAFTSIEAMLFATGLAYSIAQAMLGTSWLVVLGGFMVVSWLATRTAHAAQSAAAQYAALAAFVVAESIIFVPLLVMAQISVPGSIRTAALITLLGFTGLTVIAFTSRKDFSFLGAILKWAFMVALLAIVGSVLFGFELGTLFSLVMVALAGAAILYDTSNVLRHYSEDRHVAASLQLFASVALMFWYVLRLLSSRD